MLVFHLFNYLNQKGAQFVTFTISNQPEKAEKKPSAQNVCMDSGKDGWMEARSRVRQNGAAGLLSAGPPGRPALAVSARCSSQHCCIFNVLMRASTCWHRQSDRTIPAQPLLYTPPPPLSNTHTEDLNTIINPGSLSASFASPHLTRSLATTPSAPIPLQSALLSHFPLVTPPSPLHPLSSPLCPSIFEFPHRTTTFPCGSYKSLQ